MDYSREYCDDWFDLAAATSLVNLSNFQQSSSSTVNNNTFSQKMESSKVDSTVVSSSKKKRRKRSKKKIEIDLENISNPFLRAIERSSTPVNQVVCLPRPKKIFMETSILGLDSDSNVKCIQSIVEYETMDRDSQKFREIANLFPPTLNILKIQTVNNPFLRLSFQLKRYFTYFNVKPLKLFHGTKLKYVHSICTFNFDWRFNGTEKGHRYGQGVNFTSRPKFALNFCEKDVDVKVVILTDVLVIKKGLGSEKLELPPENCDTTIRENKSTFVKFCDG